MAKKTNKNTESSSVLESSDALAESLTKTEQFLERNKNMVFIIGGIVALIVASFFGYKYYVNTQEDKAQLDMFQAIYYYEQDSLSLALNGDGNNYGFLDIIDAYGLTPSADLASFYVGAIYLKQGQFDDAIDYLKKYDANDVVVKSRALSLIGDAYMELDNHEKAASYYDKAANHKPNKYFTPKYLIKSALAYETMGDLGKAADQYQAIVDKYQDASEYNEARKHMARLESLASE